MTTHAAPALTWEPPGRGAWVLAADHYPRPMTAAAVPLARVWSETSTRFFQELGLPIESARMELVHGLPYISMGGGGRSAPPAWLMRIMIRLVPSLRRSERRLTRVLAERPWNAGIEQWYAVDRPAAIERLRTLSRVEPGRLDDGDLAAHLEEMEVELHARMQQHISLHAHDVLPPGLFVVAAGRWGIDRAEAFGLLVGASPASAGHSDELARLRREVAGRSVGSIDELRALDDGVGQAFDELMELHGWRVVDGYDLDCSCLVEQPELVLRLVHHSPPATGAAEARVDSARRRVPPEERDSFDRLLAEGRRSYGLRDDNGGILIAWPVGLLRRAMLAAGRRLRAAGAIHDAELAVEATVAELAAALRGEVGVDAPELAARSRQRRSLRAADAPRTLGPPEAPIPAGVGGALGTVFDVFAVYGFGDERSADDLAGEGYGDRSYTGTARLVIGADPEAIARFEPGDVLVAPMTSPSYNLLLSIAGGLVTEEGGPLSHAAIMARELGLPAVLGVAGATRRIADGEPVTVDPVGGRIELGGSATTAGATSAHGAGH